MAEPVRTPVIAFDVAFSNQLDQDVQYREFLYAVLQAFKNYWTVDRSSDGTTVGAGDNWGSAAGLEINTAGNGAWAALSGPAGAAGGSTIYALLYANDTTGTPNVFGCRFSDQPYTGGDLTTLPTTVGVQTDVNPNGDDLIPYASATTSRYTTWANSAGDVFWMIKREGIATTDGIWIHENFTDAEGAGKGLRRFIFHSRAVASGNALSLGNLSGATNGESLHPGGVGTAQGAEGHATVANISAFTDGLDYNGEGLDDVINWFNDTNNSGGGRWIGQSLSWFGIPAAATFGLLDDDESTQVHRKVSVGNGVWAIAPRTSLPFT